MKRKKQLGQVHAISTDTSPMMSSFSMANPASVQPAYVPPRSPLPKHHLDMLPVNESGGSSSATDHGEDETSESLSSDTSFSFESSDSDLDADDKEENIATSTQFEAPSESGPDMSATKSPDSTQSNNPIPALQMSPIVEVLCSVLTEVYEFKEQNSWLKKSAAALLVKQCVGTRENLDKYVGVIDQNSTTF
jgi:hypothetical protein